MTSFFEKAVRLIGIAVLAFEMPVPIYWLTLHGWVSFWRSHIRACSYSAARCRLGWRLRGWP